MNVAEAKRAIALHDSIRAAVLEATETPMVESPSCTVVLFDRVGEADAHFRDRREAFLADGFEQAHGTIGRGLLGFERGDEERWLSLDKRRP